MDSRWCKGTGTHCSGQGLEALFCSVSRETILLACLFIYLMLSNEDEQEKSKISCLLFMWHQDVCTM